ncbi:MAG: hypothetical protein Fur0046_11590 [Cyanobacteria bacterium J069]
MQLEVQFEVQLEVRFEVQFMDVEGLQPIDWAFLANLGVDLCTAKPLTQSR